ncbi:MAG: ABC transporter substrate-binding protein [Lachnospiraceae bacterium]|nr:ABC transporter substrate-binding protein [Lachnospiraceae bacterium]
MKKITSMLLAVVLGATLLTGCGGAADTSATGTTDGTAVGSATESTAADNSSASTGAAFKIGGIGPVTGGAAVYGNAVKNGAQIAIDEINAAGGINGAQIEYKFEDDEHDAEKAVNAYNTLKDWNMQLLMGTVTSAPCVAVSEKTKEDNIFQLTPSGTSVPCTQYDNAFRVCFSDPLQGTASAKYIGMNNLSSKLAVIYDSSDVYSSGIYETFAKEAANQPFEIVAAEAFTADNKTDFTTQLQKAKDAGADLVFLPIYYQEATLILSQADTMGYKPAFFGCDGLDGILGVENFDNNLAEGVMLLTPFAADAKDDATVNFVTKYKEQFGGDIPNQFAADAYDAIYIIKAAIEKAGCTPDMDASAICDAVKAAMTQINVDGLTGAGMSWTADGEVNKDPKAVVIKDGVYVAMD